VTIAIARQSSNARDLSQERRLTDSTRFLLLGALTANARLQHLVREVDHYDAGAHLAIPQQHRGGRDTREPSNLGRLSDRPDGAVRIERALGVE